MTTASVITMDVYGFKYLYDEVENAMMQEANVVNKSVGAVIIGMFYIPLLYIPC